MVATREPRDVLFAKASRARWLRRGAWAAAAVSTGIASTVIAQRLELTEWIGAVDVIVVVAIGVAFSRARPITPIEVAGHLDRTVPEFEESSALLLGDDDSVLARLQRRRVRDAIAVVDVPAVPVPTARTALGIAAIAVGVAALAVVVPSSAPATITGSAATSAPAESLAIADVRVEWTPPSYTGHPPTSARALNASVEERSTVTWSVSAPLASSVAIVTSAGDTIDAVGNASGTWRASTVLTRPILWHAIARRDTGVVRSDDHLVSVIPDHPPLLAVIAPPSRIAIGWLESHVVDVRGLVSDDYGIGAIRLIATVAKGRGEGVKFREQVLDVEIESRRSATSVVVTRRLLLDSLELAPGDEVMLAFEATDRRTPDPQTGRSETIFVSMLDTLDASTGILPGITMRIEPAYFRSQRQIIIDTESLLRDMRIGRGGDTLRRSMDIGYDQHLLRLRYGELVGEETEGMGNEDEHAHDDDGPVTAADFLHNHDMQENATLLAASVKTLLKRALTAMWESEKLLRIGNARAALPHEYKALESLEEIRRASRAYVKRIGFEPPAIDVARTRLTKDAKGLASLDVNAESPDPDADAPLREALTVLGDPASDGRSAIVTAAARRLAARAVEETPGRHLETLRALRLVLDGCAACIADARAGLLASLPTPAPALKPRRSTRGALPADYR